MRPAIAPRSRAPQRDDLALATPLLALLLAGCSVVVDGLAPPSCETNSQCAVLNEMNGIANDACELYQCSPRALCELQARDDDQDGRVAPDCASAPLAQGLPVDCNDAVPSGTEVCNGIDDDCDAIIDEHFVVDGVASNPLPAEAPVALAMGLAAPARAAYAPGVDALAMTHVDGNQTRFSLVTGSTPVPSVSLGFARAADLGSLSSSTLADGCHRQNADGTFGIGDCRFHELGLALTGENVFTTVVSQGGCNAGQVRVGYFPRGESGAPRVIQRGPLRRSNAFFGVDVDTAGLPCTGASRASGVLGAARPSVAALDLAGDEDQALTAWIADAFARDECGGTDADVEVLGLHVQQDRFGDVYGWVTASDEARPQVVGRTSGGGAPGIGVWEGTGYLVGFGAPGGGVSLVFVDPMEAPAAYDRTAAPDDRTGVETAPLTITDLGTIPTDSLADDVVVAFGSIQSGGIYAGVAWREGCGGEGTIHFRQLFVAQGGGAVSIDESRSFEAIELSASATAVGPPAIVYQFSGMLEPGVARADGRPMATTQSDGGWIVAWADASEPDPGPTDDTRVLARRVSELDGSLLSSDELLVLGAPGDVRRVRPALYADADDRVRFAFLALGTEPSFRGAARTCAPGE